MPEVGKTGQERLRNGSVLLVGAGGLGSPAAYYLAAAGVGRLGIVDFDRVDESNLQRQILHFQSDIGKLKADSAKEKLSEINPYIDIETHPNKLASTNAMKIGKNYDVILDGTDNFATRYLVNDVCALLRKPNVYGSIFRFEGQASVFWAGKGPCYRCIYPEPPPPGEVPSCAEAGVLGVLPGIVGAIQASEAIKILLGIGEPLIGSLLLFDSLSMDFQKLKIAADPKCAICGPNATIKELIDYEVLCGVKQQSDEQAEVSVQELAKKRREGDDFVLLDVRDEDELAISKLEPNKHIPMDELEERLTELDKNKEILVICRTGNRSGTVAKMLRARGFDATNIAGGINAYAREIDPSLIIY